MQVSLAPGVRYTRLWRYCGRKSQSVVSSKGASHAAHGVACLPAARRPARRVRGSPPRVRGSPLRVRGSRVRTGCCRCSRGLAPPLPSSRLANPSAGSTPGLCRLSSEIFPETAMGAESACGAPFKAHSLRRVRLGGPVPFHPALGFPFPGWTVTSSPVWADMCTKCLPTRHNLQRGQQLRKQP